MKKLRAMAEWEPQDAVMVTFPSADTDWEYMLDEVRDCYYGLINTLIETGSNVIAVCNTQADATLLKEKIDSDVLKTVVCPINDTWIRDYGPLSVEKDDRARLFDFGFNGWGLKFAADKDNLVPRRLNLEGLFTWHSYHHECDFILEGGSVDFDGKGTMLTTTRCLCSPNRNGGLCRSEVNMYLNDRLGVDHVLWLDYGALEGDDTDSHVDTLARLCPNSTIIFCGCALASDPHYDELMKMKLELMNFRTAEGHPFNLLELPLPDPIYDEEGNRLPATYCNYLVTNEAVLVPSYGQPMNDSLACKIVKLAYPERKVVSVDCQALIRQHGSLHCATMQIARGLINPEKL